MSGTANLMDASSANCRRQPALFAGSRRRPRLLCLFPSTLRGGTEEYTLRIATAARQQGWDVCGGWPETSALQSFVEDWRARGLTYYPLAIDAANDSPRTLTRSHHFVRCLRTMALLWKVRPRVVLLALPWPSLGLGTMLACACCRVPTMVSFQLVPWAGQVIGKTLFAYRWAKARRQLWVVNSADGRRHLCDMFALAPGEVRIVRNGVNVARFGRAITAEERQELRRQVQGELGLPPHSRLLVTVARLHVQKGYDDLLSAAKVISREFPDVRFVWVGDGDLREHLERGIREAGLSERIVLTGYRPDLGRFYRSGELFVFPTHFEGGASFALVEAMACGAAVVSSDASGIPEVIEDGVHGLLYPAKDADALTRRIRHALIHPAEMEAMARRGRERAAELTEERMCRDTLDALQQLATSRVS
jgi:glycosyltransferase involved in cell wall biosynthesis